MSENTKDQSEKTVSKKRTNAAETGRDALLACLAYVTQHFGEARSEAALLEMLPEIEQGAAITTDMFCRAAHKIDLKTEIVSRKLDKLDKALFPVVAVLANGKACVIVGKKDDKTLQVVFPTEKTGNAVRDIGLQTLKKRHGGEVILVTQIRATEKMIQQDNDVAEFSGHWFWQVIWENKFIYMRVLIAALFVNLFVLTSPLFVMNVYDRVLPNPDALATGWALAAGAICVFVFDFLMKSLRSYFIDVGGRRGDVIWARRLYDRILDMRTDARKEPVGAFANHMREFDHIRDFFTSATLAAFIDLPFALCFIAVIYMLGGSVALVPLGLFAIVAVLSLLLQIPVKGFVRRSAKSNEEKQGVLIESLNGLETIKGCGATRHFRGRYGRFSAESALWGQKSRFWSGLSVNISSLAQQLSVVGIVLIGMYAIRDGDLSVGALIACVILGGRAIAPVGQVAGLINKYHHASNALTTLNRVMNLPTERPKDQRFLHRERINGLYAFDNVGFTYEDNTVETLHNIRFSIQPGERVGIVGRIGSGKSTLVKLMMKFYQPTSGVVRVDGADMNQIDPVDLRRDIAYVGQDTTLFRGTVRDNIAMGLSGATDEQVLRAAQLSGSNAFIRHHPLGYDAPIGENGQGFSGGQKQSIAIARALIGNPSTLICDEPTNEMDNMSEGLLINSLRMWLEERQCGLVVVTHRFSLLELVDRLIVVDQGRIVMDGPRDQVMAVLNGEQPVQAEKVEGQKTKEIDKAEDGKE